MLHPAMKPAMELLLDWRSVSSVFAALMLLNTLADHIPIEIRVFASKIFSRIFAYLKPTATIIVEEADSLAGPNDLYDSAQLYLGAHCLSDSRTVRLFKARSATSTVTSLPDSHTVHDTFKGVPVKWTSHKVERSGSGSGHYNYRGSDQGGDRRSLTLVFHQRHSNLVHNCYIPHVIEEAARLRSKSRERKLYTNRSSFPGDEHHLHWSSRTFSHPSNFDTLALDPSLLEEIRADLLRFVSRKDHYLRVGRAWKRGLVKFTSATCNLCMYEFWLNAN